MEVVTPLANNRIGLAPTGNKKLDAIKRKTAELIDAVDELKAEIEQEHGAYGSEELLRLVDFAQKDYESAATWVEKMANRYK